MLFARVAFLSIALFTRIAVGKLHVFLMRDGDFLFVCLVTDDGDRGRIVKSNSFPQGPANFVCVCEVFALKSE